MAQLQTISTIAVNTGHETAEQELARLRAENLALKNKAQFAGLGFKVSEKKGALSVYGLGRFPVTLYKRQWRKLIAKIKELEAFIEANESLLTDDKA